MAKLYFGFGLSDGMFSGDCEFTRKDLKQDGDYVQHLLDNASSFGLEVVSCLNPSHKATIDAMTKKFSISGIEIPEKAPVVKMESGDKLIVMSPRGLVRLQDRHEYTQAEIDACTFNFALWTVE